MAVEGAACGEVADEESLNAGHAYGQCLDVPAQAGQIASDVGRVSTNVRSEVMEVLVDFLREALEVGSEILTQALDSGADFGAKGAEVTTRLVPLRHYQCSQNGGYGRSCDEFLGHEATSRGRLVGSRSARGKT